MNKRRFGFLGFDILDTSFGAVRVLCKFSCRCHTAIDLLEGDPITKYFKMYFTKSRKKTHFALCEVEEGVSSKLIVGNDNLTSS